MFEIINWIIFGLFTTALIADSTYALKCLLKANKDTLHTDVSLVIFVYSSVILLFSKILSMAIPDKLSISTIPSPLLVDLIVLIVVVSLNHLDIVHTYKYQQKQAKYSLKQRIIKI